MMGLVIHRESYLICQIGVAAGLFGDFSTEDEIYYFHVERSMQDEIEPM